MAYPQVLQRACAILLLAFVSFSLIAPVLCVVLDAKLPACCLRDGKHHCAAMDMADQQDAASALALQAVRQKCPYFPKAGALPASPNTGMLSASQAFFASIVTHPAVQPQ